MDSDFQLGLDVGCGMLYEVQNHLSVLASEHSVLQERVAEVQTRNRLLKQKYDSLLEQHRNMESTYRQEKLRSSEILENMILPKQQAAVRMNHHNEKRVRAREASLHKELQMAASQNVNINEESGNVSPSKPSSPKCESSQRFERSHGPLFRSASATSPRIISSIRGLFESKIRGKSVCRSEEDLYIPLGVCLVARVPTKAIFTMDAHELGINAVRFSTNSNLLATGGTDRVIKLWGIEAGTLQNRGTLDGSNEGITSIEFDPTGTRILAASYDKSALFWRLEDSGTRILAASYDKSALFWRLEDSVPKVTELTSRPSKPPVRYQSMCVFRRAGNCTQEVPLQGRVTSLDLCPNHRQLLSCSRDDILQLVDLRKSNDRVAFRAEGFKCGSDSTKAIFSPDGSFLAAGSADGAIYIWNVNTGNLEKRLPGMHRASISAVAWSLSGEYVVSVDKSCRAVLWSDI
ncbi:autophagy-related protein 16-2-like [Sinocyclocheilus grahami]|uniref:autophagy-related protein 16-2-like n=1 Tax=Sinocyclocheilus grahami TaxID=75366 RepID=UPI0007AD0D36|nr:PREDICTED: autophagy-related protein 16-2-like [Sinocyclocheilus grahami]